MKSVGWYSIVVKKTEELPENNWVLGFFHSSYENWDGKTWVMNLHELMARDLALFALGDVKGKKILDVGCGNGVYLLTMAKMGGQVSGQDISPEAIADNEKLLRKNGANAELKVGDAAKLLFGDNSFDGVFSADFFEHISYEQKVRVISEVYRVLKPGGVFVIKTPNLDYLRISIFLKKILAILKLRSPFKVHILHTRNNPDNQHYGLTTYKELERILTDNMFHFPEITYVPLIRKKLPRCITKFLYGKKRFTEQIIISTRKPLFYSFYTESK